MTKELAQSDRAGDDGVLRAAFNPLIKSYLLMYVAMLLVLSIVGLPLAAIWLCGIGQWWANHYFKKLRCELSDTELRFARGILFTIEKTIPLENVQDVTFIEGPVLRQYHLSILKFETAGQSRGQAHDMRLIGIIDAQHFRQQILDRRRALKNREQAPASSAAHSASANQWQLLQRISDRLDEIADLLRKRGA